MAIGPRSDEGLVDDHGCMGAATLAAYGIAFARRDVAPELEPRAKHGPPT